MGKEEKIYIAGHTGMVGSSLFKKINHEGYKNIIAASSEDLDLRNQSQTFKFFERYRPEIVVNCAAKVGGIALMMKEKASFIFDNVMISSNIIESSRLFNVRKLINIASSAIYPESCQYNVTEEELLRGPLTENTEPYSLSKIVSIKMIRYYFEQYNLNALTVVPPNLYGPTNNFNFEKAVVIPVLIRKFYLSKLLYEKDYEKVFKDIKTNGFGFDLDKDLDRLEYDFLERLKLVGVEPNLVTLWGTGEAYREFLYVDDLADAIIFLIENVNAHDIKEMSPDLILNIGYGEDIKFRDLAKIISEIIGFEGKIIFDSSKPEGTYRKLLNNKKIKSLGWNPKITLTEGITKVFESYISHTFKN
ncbi:nucleoside-diphosphate-sugar epimerase [Thermosipho africanus H17ap60334]|uniref:GDP-L-fucose synthase family protein n=1 Tax=Thermosipho africanus TaxID=2421 RepID=UPI00028CC605|nr:GDP-L-fucose synthase [Thermosipho africanus]EKF50183.1 nucleoside-diphosphate-sugar epimerase [Thermosipho africanus H17ap60334]